MRRGTWKSSFSLESRGCSGLALRKVHSGAWRRAWQSSWVSSLVLWRSRRRPACPSSQRGRRCRVYNSPDVAWWRSMSPAGQGLAYICAPAVMGRVAVPDPLVGVLACALRRSGSHVEVPDPSRGRSGPPAASAEGPSLRGMWRHRTPSRAGAGPGPYM